MTIADLLSIYPLEDIKDYTLATPVKIEDGGPGGGWHCINKEFKHIKVDYKEKRITLD